jgi:hypothetical protein
MKIGFMHMKLLIAKVYAEATVERDYATWWFWKMLWPAQGLLRERLPNF